MIPERTRRFLVTRLSFIDYVKHWWSSYILGGCSVYLLMNIGDYTFIDMLDLYIHEAGHFTFMFLGGFLYMLGGTLMQIMLPSFLTFFFYKYNNKLFTQISLFWLAQNFLNISIYVADANQMKLRLIGKIHDWNFLLNKYADVEYATHISGALVIIAGILFFLVILVPFYILPVSDEIVKDLNPDQII